LAHFETPNAYENSTERKQKGTFLHTFLSCNRKWIRYGLRANRFRLCNIPFVDGLGAQMLRNGDTRAARTVNASAQASPAWVLAVTDGATSLASSSRVIYPKVNRFFFWRF
jgi:hypothetical protein